MTEGVLGEVPPSGGGTEGFEDAESVQERMLVALSKVGLALRGQAWKDATPRGLNPTQAQVLVVVARARQPGLRLSAIADKLGVSPPTVSDSVSALERKGLVVKAVAADDARALSVTLTREGRSEAERMAEWPDLLLGAVDVLDEPEEAVLLKALVKVIRALQEQGHVSPARMCVTCRYFRPRVHGDGAHPHHCAFVDAAFGDRSLRVDCVDHEAAASDASAEAWRVFSEV